MASHKKAPESPIPLKELYKFVSPVAVIPVFNTKAEYLKDCIGSLLSQSLVPEIVVVDVMDSC